MKLPGRRVARVLIPAVLAMLLAPTAPSPEPAATTTPTIEPAAAGEDPTAKGETRLRKLHLVRPDLIPYPIAYEVYC